MDGRKRRRRNKGVVQLHIHSHQRLNTNPPLRVLLFHYMCGCFTTKQIHNTFTVYPPSFFIFFFSVVVPFIFHTIETQSGGNSNNSLVGSQKRSSFSVYLLVFQKIKISGRVSTDGSHSFLSTLEMAPVVECHIFKKKKKKRTNVRA